MSDEQREKMLDLLCDKYIYGLGEEEARELERLGYDPGEAESIEQTIAMLGLVDVDAEEKMPSALHNRLTRDADDFFRANGTAEREASTPQIALGGPSRSWFGWLGWAAAAAASIALAITLFVPRNNEVVTAPPTPTPEQRTSPAQERLRLLEAGGQIVRAEWGKGNVKETETVSGDVVWSDEKQAGYMRFRGLPRNDVSKETYQLWIFDETQDPKTPIDGGTFDVSADGEVVIPIDAKLKARNPSAFAITIEKPGGVVVSDRKRIAVLAPVKPDSV